MNHAALIHAFLWTVTGFGAAGLLLPACFVIFAGFWLMGERHNAMAFLGAAAVCVAAVVAAKIGFMACGPGSVRSPSGHTALATFFYSSLGFIAISVSRARFARIFAVGCLGLIALIAVSRFTVGGHTPFETLLGFAFGAASFRLFLRFSQLETPAPGALAAVPPIGLAASFVAACLLVYGMFAHRLEPEEALFRLAHWLRAPLGC